MSSVKRILIIFIAALALTGTGIGIAVHVASTAQSSFYADGYVLQTTSDESGVTVEQVQFVSGETIKAKYPSSIQFTDIVGETITVDEESFVFYTDGSISALTDGSVMDLKEVNGGIVDYYYLEAKMVLTNGGTSYSIDNSGNTLEFSDFVWKISEDVCLMSASALTLSLSEVSEKTLTNGWFVITYLENNIVCITDGEEIWQVAASAATIATEDGVVFNLGTASFEDESGNTLLAFNEIEMDAESGIDVQSTTAVSWEAPTFNFTVIDGEDGEDGVDGTDGTDGIDGENGEAGEDGEDGEAGEDGENGETGEEGEGGTSGADGADGADGAAGSTGSDGSSSSGSSSGSSGTVGSTLPRFVITAMEYDASNVSFTIEVSGDQTDILGTEGYITIYQSADNEEVYTWSNTEFADGGEWSYDLAETDVSLSPNTTYRIVVTCDYNLGSNSGTRAFLTRTFTTTTLGTSMALDYANVDSLYLNLNTKSYSNMATAALRYTYTYNDTIVTGWYFSESNQYNGIALTSGGTKRVYLDLNWSTYGEDGTYPSDTEVTVEYYATRSANLPLDGDGTPDTTSLELVQTSEYYTLKATPSFSGVKVTVNSNYLVFSVLNVIDKDNAITKYTYRIYSESDELVKTITATDKTPVTVYVGDTDGDDSVLEEGQTYYVIVTATYYDNYKTVEIEADDTEGCSFSTEGLATALIYFEAAELESTQEWLENDSITSSTGFNYINGALIIDPQTLCIDTSQDILIVMESGANWYKTFTVNYGDSDYAFEEERMVIPISEIGLCQGSIYRFAVYGYVKENEEDTSSTYTYLGNCAVRVTTAGSLAAVISVAEEKDGERLAATVTVYDTNDDGDGVSTEMASLSYVVVEALNSSGAVVSTAVVSVGEDEESEKTAASYYSASAYSQTVTVYESDFDGLTNVNGNVTLSVSYGYDYTYDADEDEDVLFYSSMVSSYANEISIECEDLEIALADAPPELPDTSDAVTVTKIGNGAIKGYTDDSTDVNADLNDSSTTVGLSLQAVYDNSSGYAKTVTYYGCLASTYNYYVTNNLNTKGFESFSYYLQCLVNYRDGVDTSDTMSAYIEDEWKNNLSEMPLLAITLTVESSTSATTLPKLIVVFSEDEDKCANTSANKINGNYIYYTNTFGRGYHYYFTYTATLNLSLDANGQPNYTYPTNITGKSGVSLMSQLISVPYEEPEVTLYLDSTDTYTASWCYTISDPDNTLQKYQSSYKDSDGNTYNGTSGNYTDLVTNTGNPMFLAGTSADLKSKLPVNSTSTSTSSALGYVENNTWTLDNAAWASPAFISFSNTGSNGYTYSGTVTVGGTAENNGRAMYLYNIRQGSVNASTYYLALVRRLYAEEDNYVENVTSNDASSYYYSLFYQTLGGHLFDSYSLTTDEEIKSAFTPQTCSLGDGSSLLTLTYSLTQNAATHLISLRVGVYEKNDNGDYTEVALKTSSGTSYGNWMSVGFEEVENTASNDSSTWIQAQVDLTLWNVQQDTSYYIKAWAVYDTGVAGLGSAVTGSTDGLSTDIVSVRTNALRSTAADSLPTDANYLALQNATSTAYATGTTEKNGTIIPSFSTSSTVDSSKKRMLFLTTDDATGAKRTVDTTTGSVWIDRLLTYRLMYLSTYGYFYNYDNDAVLNLLYTDAGAELYNTGYYPVFKKLDVVELTTSVSSTDEKYACVTIGDLYPSLTGIGSYSYYPSFGTEKLRIQTGSSSLIIGSFSNYIYMELYKQVTDEEGNTSWERVENQTNYFTSTTTITIDGQTYIVPALAVTDETATSYDVVLQNLEYDTTYEVRFYVLPSAVDEESGLTTSVGTSNYLTNGELDLRKLLNAGVDIRLMQNAVSSNSARYDISEGELEGFKYDFTTPTSLSLTDDTVQISYNASGYGAGKRYLQIDLALSYIYEYWLEFTILDENGSTLYTHNQIMTLLGYTAYDSDGNQVATGDLKDGYLYTWMSGTTTFSYSTSMSLKIYNLTGLEAGKTYTLCIKTYYEPTQTSTTTGETTTYSVQSSSKYNNGTPDTNTFTFSRTDLTESPIATLAVSSELDENGSVIVTLQHLVIDNSYRVYSSSTSGTYEIRYYITENSGSVTTLATDSSGNAFTTNSTIVSSQIANLTADTSYTFEIWGCLDGADTATLLKSVTRTMVGSSGVSIDEDSLSITCQSPGNLVFKFKNSSGLGSVDTVEYSIFPSTGGDSYAGTTGTWSTTTSGIYTYTINLTSYLDAYAEDDGFTIRIIFKKNGTTVWDYTAEFSKDF